MLVQEAVRVLREVNNTLKIILTQMQKLAKLLPEYPIVREMGGVGKRAAKIVGLNKFLRIYYARVMEVNEK